MVAVQLLVSMVRQDPGQTPRSTDIIAIATEDMVTLRQLQAQVAQAYAGKGENVVLLYRGLLPNLSRRLYEHLPASPHKTLRFSASYQTHNRWCSKGQLFIQALSGKTFAIEANLRGTTDHIKQIAADMQGLNVKDVGLSHAGRCLKDGRCLTSYGISRDCSVRQHVPVCGGLALSVMPCKVFADVSRGDTLGKVKLVYSDSWPHRIIVPGLNMQGPCNNLKCEAFGEYVIEPMGMMTFNLMADVCHCPLCAEPFQPVTCTLWGCDWMFEGRKVIAKGRIQDVHSPWQHVPHDPAYAREFQEKKASARWYNLLLSARAPGKGDHCAVCFEPASNAVTAGCKHLFHNSCLTTWRQRVPDPAGCPSCEAKLDWGLLCNVLASLSITPSRDSDGEPSGDASSDTSEWSEVSAEF